MINQLILSPPKSFYTELNILHWANEMMLVEGPNFRTSASVEKRLLSQTKYSFLPEDATILKHSFPYSHISYDLFEAAQWHFSGAALIRTRKKTKGAAAADSPTPFALGRFLRLPQNLTTK